MITKHSFSFFVLVLSLGIAFQACRSLPEPEPACDGSLFISIIEVENSSCGEATGTITVAAIGGAGNYEYRVDEGDIQIDSTFEDLSAGLHTISITDANDCSSQIDATVPTGLVLADIRSLVIGNCAVSGCHDGTDSDQRPDFRDNASIISNAEGIKESVVAKTMPPENSDESLTDGEIELLVCWVDDGANE